MKSLLGLLSLVLIACQISFGYVINNKSPKLGEDSFKMNLFKYTFDNSVLVQPNDDFTYIGSTYLSLPYNYKYKLDPNKDVTITLTDFTSISQVTSNGQSCMLPFLANGRSNFFCVNKQDATNKYECQTVAGFGDCNLGKFMQVKRSATGNYISALVSFKTPFLFNATASYELVLNYLLNVDICSRNNYSMNVIIYNQDFNKLIFSLNDAKDDTNDKWNEARIEFQIEQAGEAYLLFQVEGYCATAVNDAFIAIDNIELNQLLEPQESTIISTTTTIVPTTTTTTMTLTSTETLPSTRLSSTSKGPTEASTEHGTTIDTHESSSSRSTTTTTTTTTTNTTTDIATTTSSASTKTTISTTITIRTTQSTSITTEPSKGDDVLLIVLLSTLIPLAVAVGVGVGVFIYYFYYKRDPKIKGSYPLKSLNMKVR